MPATIQEILKPTKYRAVDTSTSEQLVSQDLVTNSAFSGTSDLSGWTLSSDTPPTNASGNMQMNSDGATFSYARQSFTTVSGGRYKVSGNITVNGSSNTIKIGTSAGGSDLLSYTTTGTGVFEQYFIATGTTTHLEANDGASGSGNTYSYISVHRVESFGNNNHGQIYSGRALEFDGVSDYLTNSKEWAKVDNVTVAFWINSDAWNSNYGLIGRNTGNGNGGGQWAIWRNSDTQYRVYISDGSGSSPYEYFPIELPSLNTWYRVAVTFDFANAKSYCYVNGELLTTYVSSDSGTATIDSTVDSSAMRIYIGALSGASHAWAGKMSDFQYWQATWTASDALFDYLNPESLALNNGGTSLTESNLKLWYPMQDGHRGQQSYILDGANTGLGPNLVTDGDLSSGTTSNFTNSNGATTFEISTAQSYVGNYSIHIADASSYRGVYQNISTDLTVGVTYKISARVYVVAGSVRMEPADGISNDATHVISTTTGQWELLECFFTVDADSTETIFIARTASSDSEFYVDDMKLQAVNDKHHATTVFYGDELIQDDKNQIFDESGDWAGYGSPTSAAISSGKFQVETTGDSSAEGAYLAVGGELTAPVIGRTYRISAFLDDVGTANADATYKFFYGGTGVLITASDGSPNNGTINTENQEYYADVVATNTTGNLEIRIVAADNDAATTFTIDGVSVKEVGTASGWTAADQQLDIPQTALQSYNQLAWFDGDNDVVNCGSGSDIDNIFTGGGTISVWIYPNSFGESSYPRIVQKAAGTSPTDGWYFSLGSLSGSDCKLRFRQFWGSGTHYGAQTTNTVIKLGEWNHVVLLYNEDSDNNDATIYVNGESVDISEVDDPDGGTVSSEADRDLLIGNDTSGERSFEGCITELSYWNDSFTQSEVNELYNDGKGLDAREHSAWSLTNLKGYWRNNGLSTWTDLSNYGNNGTISNCTETLLLPAGVDASRDNQGFLMNRQKDTNSFNAPSYHEDDPAVDDNAMFSYVDAPNFNNDVFSVSCWFKPAYLGENQHLIQSRDSSDEGWVLYVDTSGDINFKIGDGTDTVTIDTGSNAVVDTWVHIAVTYAGSAGAIATYINGSAGATGTATNVGDMSSVASELRIGARSFTSPINGVNGQIDDVLLYSDVLTADEVDRIYKAGKRSHR